MTKHQIDLYEAYHLSSNIEDKFAIAREIIESNKTNPIPEYCRVKTDIIDGELWRNINIEGFSCYFQVSNYGRLKRLFRIIGYRNGNPKIWPESILPASFKDNGRLRNTLYVDNKRKTVSPQRLVLGAFSENTNNLPHINHIDGNPANNHFLNLEYSSVSYNELHSYRVLGKKNHMIGKTLDKSHVSNGKIGQYSLGGELIRIFSCIAETKEHNFLPSHVGRVISGERKTHANFIWKSLKEETNG